MCNVCLNGASDDIIVLLSTCNASIFVHSNSPSSVIPHDSFAYKILRDFANGAHVVILLQ